MAKILSKGEYTTLQLINSSTVLKTATEEGVKKLAKEIDFLELNKAKFHYSFFPDIFSYEITKKHASYSMPYIPGPLLRNYIYSESNLSLCERSLVKTISNLGSLHCEPGIIKAAEFTRRFYFDRLQARWEKLTSEEPSQSLRPRFFSIQNISSSDVRAIFSLIAKGITISIDGRVVNFSIKRLIDSLVSLKKIFETPQSSIRFIHGDPHAGNILLHDSDAVFLDPNGFMDGGDIAYDFSKLLVSLDWHDLSMMNLLEPAEINIASKRIEVMNNKVHKNEQVHQRHNILRQKIVELLIEKVIPLYENDPLLLQRIKLLLYIHQFSFAPTLIKEKPQTALHILLNAISDYTTLVHDKKFSFYEHLRDNVP